MLRWSQSSFMVSDPYPASGETVPEEIYDLLGLGDLRDEVMEYLFALLKKQGTISAYRNFRATERVFLALVQRAVHRRR